MIRLHTAIIPLEVLSIILGRVSFAPCSRRARIRSPNRSRNVRSGRRLAMFARTPDMEWPRLQHFTHNLFAGNSDRETTDTSPTLMAWFGAACSKTMVDCINPPTTLA